MLKTRFYLFAILLASTVFLSDAREVLGWIPAYRLEAAKTSLKMNCGAFSPKDGLSAIALQFWLPTKSGQIVLDTGEGATKKGVEELKQIADSFAMKTLLCVYNYFNKKWDWDTLAISAFKTSKTAFAKAIVDEVKAYNLDGVDLDLESEDDRPKDRKAFADFVKELYPQLHAIGKTLSVATYNTPCFNAPNMAWWKDWKGYVDNVHTMNYTEGYEYCEKTEPYCTEDPSQDNMKVYKYSYTVTYGLNSGVDTAAISIGVMTTSSWGTPAQDATYHLQSILDLPAVPGVCIWQVASLSGTWATSALWEKMAAIKKYGSITDISLKQAKNPGTSQKSMPFKISGNTCIIPENFRGKGHYAAIYSLQGRLLEKIQLYNAKTIPFKDVDKSMIVRIVQFF